MVTPLTNPLDIKSIPDRNHESKQRDLRVICGRIV